MSILLPRREFIAVLGGAAAWPLAVIAKQQTKPTIGWLRQRPGGENIEAFRRGLAEIGILEGRDVTVVPHVPSGFRRLPLIWYSEGRRELRPEIDQPGAHRRIGKRIDHSNI